MTYTDYEYEIFSRQFILKVFSEQNVEKLEKSKISIIGIGGIGCPLATYLVSSGLKYIQLIDGDIIEKSNLNRQILFTSDDIGQKKVTIAKKKLLEINPNCQIKIIDENLNKSNINNLCNSSIIIDTSDSWETMKIVNEYCVKESIPLVSSSVVGFDVEVALFENKKNHHLCLNCLFPNKNDIDLPRCDTVGVSGIAAGMAGLLAAQKTINFLINLNQKSNILSLLNVLKEDLQNINLKNNSKCYLNKF
mgnify:FL=1